MLNLPPSSYRTEEDGERTVNTKKVFTGRRLWYAPHIEAPPVLHQQEEDYNQGYEDFIGSNQYDYDRNAEYDQQNPVRVQQAEPLDLEATPAVHTRLNLAPEPTTSSVSGFSIANAVNVREAVLVALGGASAALVLLIVMAGVFVARRRKNSPSPAPSPPILVYPPHDITGPCFM
ncbi:hypothetical protein O0L34_g399 [Tuta absoluta]|nr:hypothetical protein O0L34_g399 [Tuta absoluta]